MDGDGYLSQMWRTEWSRGLWDLGRKESDDVYVIHDVYVIIIRSVSVLTVARGEQKNRPPEKIEPFHLDRF